MILCKVIHDTCPSNTYYLGKYHVLLFPDFQVKEWLSGNLVGISINLCKSIQKELFINDTS